MRLTKKIVIITMILFAFLSAIISIFIFSLQKHESISRGSIPYYLLVDNRIKGIEVNHKFDFIYIPADGTSPEIHILNVYTSDSFDNQIERVYSRFDRLGFKEVNGELRQGKDVLIVEKNREQGVLSFSLYIY